VILVIVESSCSAGTSSGEGLAKLHRHLALFYTLTVTIAGLACQGCPAADWGYDNAESPTTPVIPLRAKVQSAATVTADPLRTQKAPAGKAGGAANKTVARNGTAARPASGAAQVASPFARGTATAAGQSATTADSTSLVKQSWVQLFELAGAQQLENQQTQEILDLVQSKLNGSAAQKQEALSILVFWPKLTAYLGAHEDQRENYSSLLRALLRYKARNLTGGFSGGTEPDQEAANEANIISEVLGPQRLSVPGTVPFSEDAMNAYADMACFIYERRNPGKSVDALDNRAVFATVVSQKFKDAPTKKDQEAMAAFDLSWAKFKIVWTQADESQRAALLNGLMKQGAGAAWAQGHNSMLELVLNNWPNARSKSSSVASSAAEAQHK
jgi:hypothetical protein